MTRAGGPESKANDQPLTFYCSYSNSKPSLITSDCERCLHCDWCDTSGITGCSRAPTHHKAESAILLSRLRQPNPAPNPVIDKLDADHQRIADLLDEVEAAAQALGGTPTGRHAGGWPTYSAHWPLICWHLSYEEEPISDTPYGRPGGPAPRAPHGGRRPVSLSR